jgi:hypothetical protein
MKEASEFRSEYKMRTLDMQDTPDT